MGGGFSGAVEHLSQPLLLTTSPVLLLVFVLVPPLTYEQVQGGVTSLRLCFSKTEDGPRCMVDNSRVC